MAWVKKNLKVLIALIITLWFFVQYQHYRSAHRDLSKNHQKLEKDYRSYKKFTEVSRKSLKKAIIVKELAVLKSEKKIKGLDQKWKRSLNLRQSEKSKSAKTIKNLDLDKNALILEIEKKDNEIAALLYEAEIASEIIHEYKKISDTLKKEIKMILEHNTKLHELNEKCTRLYQNLVIQRKKRKWFTLNVGVVGTVSGQAGVGLCIGLKIIDF